MSRLKLLIILMFVALACIVIWLTSFPRQPFSNQMPELNEYAVNLFKSSFEHQEKNLYVSHLAFFEAITTVYDLSTQDTRDSIDRCIGFSLSSEEIRTHSKELMSDLIKGRKGITGSSSNFVFIQKELELKPELLKAGKLLGSHKVVSIDFKSPEVADQINDVLCKSIGVDPLIVGISEKYDEDSSMVLSNALVYSGDWTEPFLDKTEKFSFHLMSGSKKEIEFMKKEGFEYSENDYSETAFLQIGKGDYGFLLVLPKNYDLRKVIELLSVEDVIAMIEDLEPIDEPLELPHLNLNFENRIEFGSAIDPKGVYPQSVCKPGRVFKNSNVELFPSAITQRSSASFNTKTGKAVIESNTESFTPCGFEGLTFDKPFLFLLVHRATSSIVGIGAIIDPD